MAELGERQSSLSKSNPWWTDSEAYQLRNALEHALTGQLRGYEKDRRE
jgi:hypothetical protein